MTGTGVMTFLVEMKWVLLALIGMIVLLVYRGPISHLLQRLSRLSKTDEGYTLEAGATPSPEVPEDKEDDDEEEMLAASGSIAQVDGRAESGEGEDHDPEKQLLDAWTADNPAAAIEGLERIATKTDDDELNLRARILIGDRLAEQDFAKGIQFLRELKEEYPGEGRVYNWLAILLAGADLYQEALEELNTGIDQAADNGRLIVSKADLLKRMGRRDQAISFLERHKTDTQTIPRLYTRLGEFLEEKNEIQKARESFLEGLSRFPQQSALLRRYGRFLSENAMHEEAALRFLRLRKLKPEEATAPTLLANELLTLGLNGKALEFYEEGNKKAGGEEAWIHANIGNLMNNSGLYGPAIRNLERALELNPDSDYAHSRLAAAQETKETQDKKLEKILETARAQLGDSGSKNE